jgi:hypothetical protein
MIFIQEITEAPIKIRMELPSGSERLKYRGSLEVCENPLCRCMGLTLHLPLGKELPGTGEPETIAVSFDLRDKKLNMKTTPAGDIPFARRILEQMDDSDWKILSQAYYALKREYAANTPIEELDFDFSAIYDYSEIDDGKLVPFHSVFIFKDELFFDINGKGCTVLPMFCLARGCKCTTANIEIHEIVSREANLSVLVDYRKGEFSGFEKNRWDAGILTQDMLTTILLGAFPDLFARLAQMHSQLAKLYKISRARYYRADVSRDKFNSNNPFELPAETFRRETEKVGRNDPCPCGSGKKYKKCCLK